MRIPLSWLKEFIEISLSPKEIAEALTLAGLEVEKIDSSSLPGDAVFEISLTPNLGHCMSVLGVARELAAIKNLSLKKRKTPVREDKTRDIDQMIQVEIQNRELCQRYACRIVKDLKVAPSPSWLKNRLEASGIRSINNVVDVTNYVMLECGQPLHAFDYDCIEGKTLRVTAKSSFTSLLTLDDKTCALSSGMLLIADGKKPLALAGVMGGKESMVTDKSRSILLEAAVFSPQTVRKTSKLTAIRSDSSQRFEKGVDGEALIEALERATSLIEELAQGVAVKGMIDQKTVSFSRAPLTCRLSRVNRILGTALSLREVAGIFERLEIQIVKEENETLHVVPPSYRHDLQTEIDLIEEVGRLFGFNQIFSKKKPRHISSTMGPAPLYLMEKRVREELIAQSLQECITCNLISPALAELTAEHGREGSWIPVLHPASVDQSILRTSLLAGLLQMVKFNQNQTSKNVNAFEIGRVHFKEGNQFKEQTVAGIICCGAKAPYNWDTKSSDVDFFDLKGKVENLLLSFGISDPLFEVSHLHNFHPGRQVRVRVGERTLGVLGEIHPLHTAALDIKARVLFSEINLLDLMQAEKKSEKIEPLPAYPGSERDWTLSLKEEAPIGQILQLIRETPSPVLEKVILLDIYQANKSTKNVTFRLFYRDREKTISQERVESEHGKITQEVAKKAQDRLV